MCLQQKNRHRKQLASTGDKKMVGLASSGCGRHEGGGKSSRGGQRKILVERAHVLETEGEALVGTRGRGLILTVKATKGATAVH